MPTILSDIIGRYDGTNDFSEWLAKFELVARLQKLKELESIMALFLSKGAFVVYEGLSDDEKHDYGKLKRESVLRQQGYVIRITMPQEDDRG